MRSVGLLPRIVLDENQFYDRALVLPLLRNMRLKLGDSMYRHKLPMVHKWLLTLQKPWNDTFVRITGQKNVFTIQIIFLFFIC